MKVGLEVSWPKLRGSEDQRGLTSTHMEQLRGWGRGRGCFEWGGGRLSPPQFEEPESQGGRSTSSPPPLSPPHVFCSALLFASGFTSAGAGNATVNWKIECDIKLIKIALSE